MNRTQRPRRSRLVSLALTAVTVLAVGLPAAAPALAATGDSLKITVGGSSTYAAGAVGATFTARVASNSITKLAGIQASVSFDNTRLQVQSITRVAGTFWASATLPIDGTDVATSNADGKVGAWAATYIATTGSPTSTDVGFIDIGFKVISCPASGSAGTLGLPTGAADSVFTDTTGTAITPDPIVPATITCTPPAPNEFSLGVSPSSVTIAQGGSATAAVTAAFVSGTAETVALTGALAPANAGVSFTFTPASVTPTGGSQLAIAVSASAATGTFTLTVTGTSASTSHTATLSITVTPPPAGPPAVSGVTLVSGSVDNGFLGVSVAASTQLRLLRDTLNTTQVPVVVFSNTAWTLSVEDAMTLAGGGVKAAADRGRMLDVGASPVKRLERAMQASSGASPVRTLDVAGPQSLVGGSMSTTVPVTLSQRTLASDPPGNYAIDVRFSAISGF